MNLFRLLWSFLTEPGEWLEIKRNWGDVPLIEPEPDKQRTMWG